MGRTWKVVLDFHPDKLGIQCMGSFGLQNIAFKDSLTGIAVGQFSKIIYTYDGGRTWIYESDYHERSCPPYSGPAVMDVEYFKGMPLATGLEGDVYYMTEDNLAPKPEDTLDISGYVLIEGTGEGAPIVSVALGNRICMTDSTGYYHFSRVAPGQHRLRVLNKYYSGTQHPDWVRRPYLFEPEQGVELSLTGDTVIDFTAVPNVIKSVAGEGTENQNVRINAKDGILEWQLIGEPKSINRLLIHDLSGRIIFESNAPRSPIDITTLPSGSYWLVLIADGEQPYSGKFIVD
jgi:hypothetical protein